MEEQDVSVNALHLATGLSRQTISRSLDGIRTLDFRQFDKIATALGRSHRDIIQRYTELAA
jgi:transcriptional regulator with XRE-family HTH domain